MATVEVEKQTTVSECAVPDRAEPATTVSGVPIAPLYTGEDLARLGITEPVGIGRPGQFPFTRGIHKAMYRDRLWTMRQFAGFGTARQTNERFRFLAGKGTDRTEHGLRPADLDGAGQRLSAIARRGRPTGRGGRHDRRHAPALRRHRPGTNQRLDDDQCPGGHRDGVLPRRRSRGGLGLAKLRGTIQNDILKEFHAQNEIVFPPEPSVRLVIDLIEFCTQNVPQWNTVSISGYHIREAGSTAVQELAFTLADGIHYVEECLKRGLDVDQVGRRLSFFFNAHNDVFEEIAKYRAARSLWADVMRNRFKARDESAWKLRFHAQTAGCSLQDRQPEVNLIRVAYQALAAVLGGCQSLHSNSMDETLALPSEHAVTLALRTQQVLAYETGVPNTPDPLGGSYFVETLTQQMRQQAEEYFERIDQQGGMLAAIDSGFFRREIAEAAFAYQKSVDKREKIIVGVNAFEEDEHKSIDILQIDEGPEQEQIGNLLRLKQSRDSQAVRRALDNVKRAAERKENVFPALLEAATARATVYETMSALADVLGRHETGGLS